MDSFTIAVLTVLAVAAAPAGAELDDPAARYLVAYEGQACNGPFYEFSNSSSDLGLLGIDGSINSFLGTGEWILYDNANYELFIEGLRGFDNCLNVSGLEVSSFRYAGSPYGLNDIYYNLYEGTTFQGIEFKGNTDARFVGSLDNKVSSLIITGQSPWTFYTGLDYEGVGVCVYPDLDYTSEDGIVINTFWLPYMILSGLPDDSIRSVRKGCWSPAVVKASSLEHAFQNKDIGKKIISTQSRGKLQRAADNN